MGLSTSAKISSHAKIGNNVRIGDFVIIHDNVEVGDNTIIESYCELGVSNALCDATPLIIGANSHIRSHSLIYASSQLGAGFVTGHRATIREKTIWEEGGQAGTLCDIQGHCSIGKYVRMHSNVHVGQLSRIKDFALIFPYVVLTNDPHPPSASLTGCVIDEFAVLCTMAVVLPGVHVGKDTLIGAGSIVNRDVPDQSIVVGNPGKVVGKVDRITFKNQPDKHVYPWRRHFHRGYPDHVIEEWKKEFPHG